MFLLEYFMSFMTKLLSVYHFGERLLNKYWFNLRKYFI